jgi:lipopolysaccharide transport system permease protein
VNPFGFIPALWRQRELLWQFTVRNVELRHRGSHLGLAWSLLNPLLMMSLYVFVFGYIFGGRFNVLRAETKIDYALAIFLGLTVFQIVAEVMAVAPTTIVSNPNFVKKVVFPLEILPAAGVASSLFHMLVALAIVLIGAATVGPGLNVRILWLPVILFPITLFSLGLAWFFAAIGVFFRDLNQFVAFLSMALMYASALFYPVRIIPPIAWSILKYNPILLAVDLARSAVLWNQEINIPQLLYLTVFSFIACVLGYWSFKKLAPAFADVL